MMEVENDFTQLSEHEDEIASLIPTQCSSVEEVTQQSENRNKNVTGHQEEVDSRQGGSTGPDTTEAADDRQTDDDSPLVPTQHSSFEELTQQSKQDLIHSSQTEKDSSLVFTQCSSSEEVQQSEQHEEVTQKSEKQDENVTQHHSAKTVMEQQNETDRDQGIPMACEGLQPHEVSSRVLTQASSAKETEQTEDQDENVTQCSSAEKVTEQQNEISQDLKTQKEDESQQSDEDSSLVLTQCSSAGKVTQQSDQQDESATQCSNAEKVTTPQDKQEESDGQPADPNNNDPETTENDGRELLSAKGDTPPSEMLNTSDTSTQNSEKVAASKNDGVPSLSNSLQWEIVTYDLEIQLNRKKTDKPAPQKPVEPPRLDNLGHLEIVMDVSPGGVYMNRKKIWPK